MTGSGEGRVPEDHVNRRRRGLEGRERVVYPRRISSTGFSSEGLVKGGEGKW